MKDLYNKSLIKTSDFTELHLHYLWGEKNRDIKNARDFKSQAIKIIFPGWYNRSSGPDFLEARILIGDHEMFGDIEIHLNETSWFDHGHSTDSHYNRVILHVFLYTGKRRAENSLGLPIPSLSLEGHFASFSTKNTYIIDPSKMMHLPGACGLKISSKYNSNIKRLILSAAEQRLVNKSEPPSFFVEGPEFENLEDQLFTNICCSLGYASNAILFTNLARTFPYSEIAPFFTSTHRKSRIKVLSRWLGYLGFLDQYQPEDLPDNVRREWILLKENWKSLNQRQKTDPIQKISLKGRPYNHPLRRIIGLYHHLEQVHFKGLFKSWLFFLQQTDQLLLQKKGVTLVLQHLEKMFPQTDWDSFNEFPNVQQHLKAFPRFIGKTRQLTILVNAVIPFYLRWAREHKNKELERTLLNLFLVLPGEGKNNKTSFMEKRFNFPNNKIKIRKNLSYHQGLIQIHDDFCRSFYEGCVHCSFMDLL